MLAEEPMPDAFSGDSWGSAEPVCTNASPMSFPVWGLGVDEVQRPWL